MKFLLMLHFLFFAPMVPKDNNIPQMIYEFKVTQLDGKVIDMAQYKGKKILIVNTASKCGYTPQYKDLEALYQKYKDKMVIIGFPANDFGEQEPGTNDEIAHFCSNTYNVTFPMSEKITVKGDDMAPIYKWLTNIQYNRFKSSEVKWNFQKYLINEKGELVAVFDSKITPLSNEVISAIEKKY